MLAPKILSLAALVALLAALVATPAMSAPAEKASFRSCPDMKRMFTGDIRVRNVACQKAQRVIVRYTRGIIDDLQHDWSLTVLGFRCDLTGKDYYGDSHRCTASGDRVIRFRRGTH
ncbi:MAG TPA: hypothetical protein VKB23_13135 [Solirubrobacterales bacterium]|nr:hypothetical protein [Solirubrobacterales bacterium]